MNMEQHTTRNPSSKSNNKGIWYLLAVVLLLLFIFGLASNKKKQQETTVPGTGAGVSPVRKTTGSYAFNLSPGTTQVEPQTTFSVGTAKAIAITMNTDGRQILGFNAIIQYDPQQMSIGRIGSTVPAFTAYQTEAVPGYIVVDAVKTSPDNTPIVFSNTAVLSVPVTVKNAGTYNIRLVEQNNKDKAKFFDEKLNPYYPMGAVVTIQSK